MKPSAYISDGGILFKESPPDSILKLSPLYTSAEIQALHNLVKEQQTNYEKGFIDGMNKQMQSRVQQMVDGYAKLRELSDEEINQIVWQQNLLLGNDDLRKFARAILKKASEK